MDLMRLSVSKNTKIRKSDLDARATLVAHRWPDIATVLPRRNDTNTVRVALASKLRAWQRFDADNGDQCRAIATPTKGAKGLDIRVHVQRRGTDSVEYSQEILAYSGGNGEPLRCDVMGAAAQYPDLVADLGTIADLLHYGEAYWFDNDIRILAQTLLDQALMPLWPGVTLVLSKAGREAVRDLERLLEPCLDGSVTCRLLSLDNTPANREALARELGEHLEKQAAEILEALGYPDPNLKRCRALYTALLQKVEQAEQLLEVEIPEIWIALAQIEIGLETEEEQAE